jgi:UDP-N-acetylmuramyl pentapeptide phosphotransferase/UDP-N-acetylglucosamine-1-phosphate transferase
MFNWHPAKIFMGDTGSLSLGFALSTLTVLFIDTNGTMSEFQVGKFYAPIASGVALLIVPVYDTTRIFIKRALKGKSPLTPDKCHVHHFLLRMGLKHDQVTITLGLVNFVFIGLIFAGRNLDDHILLPIVLLSALVMGFRLDAITLRRVKEICRKSPRVLATKSLVKQISKKPVIQPEILRKAKINDN